MAKHFVLKDNFLSFFLIDFFRKKHQFLRKNIENKEELEKFFENFVKKIRIYTKCKLYTPPALFYSFFYFLPFFVDFLETKFYAFLLVDLFWEKIFQKFTYKGGHDFYFQIIF